jgi:NAD(P)-dependent dehydrogenase (short-subunit alcohol dehydrogenase family)
MRTILITGAASGLGLAFLRHYLTNQSNYIFAIDRHWPDELDASIAPAGGHRLAVVIVDVSLPKDLARLSGSLHEILSPEERIDLVVHCAGIRGLVGSVPIKESSDVARAETLEVMDKETMMRAFEINVAGTLALVQCVLPHLQRRGSEGGDKPGDGVPAKVVVMGSRMGSVSANSSGGGYAYRASKAALNAVVKSLSWDVMDVCFVLVHPGRVATGLCDGVREDGAIDVAEVVPQIADMIGGWSIEHSGRLLIDLVETSCGDCDT